MVDLFFQNSTQQDVQAVVSDSHIQELFRHTCQVKSADQ